MVLKKNKHLDDELFGSVVRVVSNGIAHPNFYGDIVYRA